MAENPQALLVKCIDEKRVDVLRSLLAEIREFSTETFHFLPGLARQFPSSDVLPVALITSFQRTAPTSR